MSYMYRATSLGSVRRALALCLASCLAGTPAAGASNPIDLPTALQLAGAKDLDVQIARERVNEARAAHDSARARYFPWVSPSITFRKHDNNAQNVEGLIIDADKKSLAAALTLNAQIDLGETYYQNLVARQVVRSNEAALAGREREATFRAAAAYFELARARAGVIAAEEAARISGLHAEQIAVTTEAGITFAGDAARVQSARERAALTLVRVRADQRIAAARLAEILRLDPVVELTPVDADLAPMSLGAPTDELGALVSRALATRPELDEAAARLEAARALRRGSTRAPLIPTIGAQASVGGLGGGPGGSTWTRDFDHSGDYALGVSWRVGPGGLFDKNRQREAVARENQVQFEQEKVRDLIRRQVVEQHTRLSSFAAQIELARKTLDAADQTARLSRQRRETGVSGALEDLQAEDELARARRDYLATITDYNLAQYALKFVVGD
jgi:outer membrane protein TolC